MQHDAPSLSCLREHARPLADIYADFRAHGFARVGRLASEETLTLLRARIDDIMLGKVRYEGMFFQRDTDTGRYEDLRFGHGYEGPSLNYRKVEKLEMDPLFLAWIQQPFFRQLCTDLVGPDISLYRALIFNKSAETGGSHLPWHQDGGRFWGLSLDPTLQIWTALDDAPASGGCLEIVRGSHVHGLATPLGGVVPAEKVLDARAEDRKELVPAVAGEVILVHNHVWHRSSRSTTGLPRRALTVCYMDARTRCLRTKRAPRSFFRVWS